MITCPRCGYQAPDGTPYCPRCGYGKPQQIPPAPEQQPEQEPKPKDPSKVNFRTLSVILGIAAAYLLVAYLVADSGRINLHEQVRSFQQTVSVQNAQLRALIQTATAFAAGPSATPEPTATQTAIPESETVVKDPFATDYDQYCGTMLTIWQHSAGLDNVPGSLQQSDFDTDQNACRYILSGTNTGSMTLYLDPADDGPFRAAFEIDGTYPSDRNILIGWASHIGAYLDFVAPATAKRYIDEAMESGSHMLGSRFKITVDRSADPILKLDLTK